MKIKYLLVMAILFAGCDRRMKLESKEIPPSVANAAWEETADEIVAFNEEQPDVAVERKLIRNGRLHFKTKDIKQTRTELDKLCQSLNAYISTETQNTLGDGLMYSQKIRVPANRFDELLQKTEQLAEKVEERSIDTQDVTEEFIDVESRLKTKKELERRYLDLLNKGRNVEELLSIERELAEVRGDIEAMEGKLNYLKNQVAFSTLDVSYYEQKGKDFGFCSRLAGSLGTGWTNLLEFLIGVMAIWPFVLILAIGIVWFMKWQKKKAVVQ
jgi:hypothetical protein